MASIGRIDWLQIFQVMELIAICLVLTLERLAGDNVLK